MSRIGRAPIEIPAGVNVEIDNGTVTVSGTLGKLEQAVDKLISIEKTVEAGKNYLVLTRANDEADARAKHGLYRALVQNMVTGVSKGYSKTLIIKGVGYKASVSGDKLTLNIGFSHPIEFVAPTGIKVEVVSPTEVKVSGFDKVQVGQVAANIRAFKPVEPYHLYGIRYSDEVVVKKEGKKASAKKK